MNRAAQNKHRKHLKTVKNTFGKAFQGLGPIFRGRLFTCVVFFGFAEGFEGKGEIF
jgi:hypothetical protein